MLIKNTFIESQVRCQFSWQGKEGLREGQILESISHLIMFKEYFTHKHGDAHNFFLKIINPVKNNFWENAYTF